MKKFKTVIFTIAMATLLFSCEGKLKTETLTSTSEDGSLTIEVSGSREMLADPMIVKITAMQNEKKLEYGISPEVYVNDLTVENVAFNWTSNTSCNILFTQRDGVVFPVPVSVGP